MFLQCLVITMIAVTLATNAFSFDFGLVLLPAAFYGTTESIFTELSYSRSLLTGGDA